MAPLEVASSVGNAVEPSANRGAGRILINFVHYDTAGSDGSNPHVNREIVKVTNTNQRRSTPGGRSVTAGHRYWFPRTSLGRNDIVTLDGAEVFGGGHAVDTAGLAGWVTVINFWASWCDSCREEMPMLSSVVAYSGDRVRFNGVNTKDQPLAATDFLEDTGVRFEQLHDPDGELLRQLGTVQGLPVTLVLDAAGAVTLRHIGQIDGARLVDALDTSS